MEPKNHPFTKENRLPNLHFQGSMLNFGGVDFVRTSTPAVHGVPDLFVFSLPVLAFQPFD